MSSDQGWCLWITGLPSSGKSVVSKALVRLLLKRGIHAQVLSSDALRRVLTPRPTYSQEERDRVYATLGYIAKLLTQNGVNVVIDATGNFRRYREAARKEIPRFIEVYLSCPLEVCMKREATRRKTHLAPRRIYSRALEGKAPTVPGIGQPYEEPLDPEIMIDSASQTPPKAAQGIIQFLLAKRR